jgi:endogenous inhibitor of DNA gyrase (YacG/DUF329 family)
MPAKCPICSKLADPAYRPFCSRRCADIDLQRWLVGRYAIPAAREGDDDDAERADPSDPEPGPPGQGPYGRL